MWLTPACSWRIVGVAEEASCRAFSPDREGFMATKWGRDGHDYLGPTLEDCNKCWWTITHELVTDAQLRLEPQPMKEPKHRARLVVWSPGLDPETGGPREHVWATKELQDSFEAITYRQLYDLLIVAYRKMEAHLSGQTQAALP